MCLMVTMCCRFLQISLIIKQYLFHIFTGFVVPFKAHFNEDSPIWLLGRCYHARNHGKGYAYHLDFLSSRQPNGQFCRLRKKSWGTFREFSEKTLDTYTAFLNPEFFKCLNSTCYHSRNHGNFYAYHLGFLSTRQPNGQYCRLVPKAGEQSILQLCAWLPSL